MHHFRVLALAVEQRQTGAFDWVLLESFDDVEAYAPFERSSLHYASRSEAFEAGNKSLRQLDHDLRTPLGTVHAALDILRSTADRDGALRNETLALMDRQVARLRSLVQSLHELTRDMEGEVGSKPGP